MPHFQFSPYIPKCLGPPLFPSHSLSTSTTSHRAPQLTTKLSFYTSMTRAFQTHHLQPHTTVEIQQKSNHDHHHGQNPAKIKSQQKPRSPPNHKSNHTHRNQSIKPTKQPKSQNENTESEPTVKKTYIGFVIIFQKKNHLVELILDPN